MSEDPTPDDVPIPVEFTFRPWNPRVESWDEFMGALERAYAEYVSRCRHAPQDSPPGGDSSGPPRVYRIAFHPS